GSGSSGPASRRATASIRRRSSRSASSLFMPESWHMSATLASPTRTPWQPLGSSAIFQDSGEPTLATIKPILLLADSQLLFYRGEEGGFLEQRVRALLDEEEPNPDPKAAYLGASNGDAPEFYELFRSAMSTIDIRTTRL